MNDNQKTTLDILAEMRKECGDPNARYLGMRIIHRMEDTRVRQYCDRLEAAWNREELRWAKANGELAKMLDCEKAQAGNAAALREALKMFVDAYRTTSYTLCLENLRPSYQKANAALSAPPTISEEYAKPTLCKTCAHYKADGCEICGCMDYEEKKGDNDGK